MKFLMYTIWQGYNWEFQSIGSKDCHLPVALYVSTTFKSKTVFPSISLSCISFFSKILGSHGTHRIHSNYAPLKIRLPINILLGLKLLLHLHILYYYAPHNFSLIKLLACFRLKMYFRCLILILSCQLLLNLHTDITKPETQLH